MSDDPAVEALAKWLYLNEDDWYDHRVVPWHRLPKQDAAMADTYRRRARARIAVVDTARARTVSP